MPKKNSKKVAKKTEVEVKDSVAVEEKSEVKEPKPKKAESKTVEVKVAKPGYLVSRSPKERQIAVDGNHYLLPPRGKMKVKDANTLRALPQGVFFVEDTRKE